MKYFVVVCFLAVFGITVAQAYDNMCSTSNATVTTVYNNYYWSYDYLAPVYGLERPCSTVYGAYKQYYFTSEAEARSVSVTVYGYDFVPQVQIIAYTTYSCYCLTTTYGASASISFDVDAYVNFGVLISPYYYQTTGTFYMEVSTSEDEPAISSVETESAFCPSMGWLYDQSTYYDYIYYDYPESGCWSSGYGNWYEFSPYAYSGHLYVCSSEPVTITVATDMCSNYASCTAYSSGSEWYHYGDFYCDQWFTEVEFSTYPYSTYYTFISGSYGTSLVIEFESEGDAPWSDGDDFWATFWIIFGSILAGGFFVCLCTCIVLICIRRRNNLRKFRAAHAANYSVLPTPATPAAPQLPVAAPPAPLAEATAPVQFMYVPAPMTAPPSADASDDKQQPAQPMQPFYIPYPYQYAFPPPGFAAYPPPQNTPPAAALYPKMP